MFWYIVCRIVLGRKFMEHYKIAKRNELTSKKLAWKQKMVDKK